MTTSNGRQASTTIPDPLPPLTAASPELTLGALQALELQLPAQPGDEVVDLLGPLDTGCGLPVGQNGLLIDDVRIE